MIDVKVTRYGGHWHAWCESCRWVSSAFDSRDDADKVRDMHVDVRHQKAS